MSERCKECYLLGVPCAGADVCQCACHRETPDRKTLEMLEAMIDSFEQRMPRHYWIREAREQLDQMRTLIEAAETVCRSPVMNSWETGNVIAVDYRLEELRDALAPFIERCDGEAK